MWGWLYEGSFGVNVVKYKRVPLKGSRKIVGLR